MKLQREIYVDPEFHKSAQQVSAVTRVRKADLIIGAELFGVREHRHEDALIGRITAQLYENAKGAGVRLFPESIVIFTPREGVEVWELHALGWGYPA